jgi:Fe2+ transport system protein FeoA
MGSKLPDCKVGKCGIVRQINTDHSAARRLNSMGIFPGAPIRLITKGPSGCLVSVGCAKISLESGMAGSILVA